MTAAVLVVAMITTAVLVLRRAATDPARDQRGHDPIARRYALVTVLAVGMIIGGNLLGADEFVGPDGVRKVGQP